MAKTYSLPVKLDKGSGTPLVLLHGLGNNYSSWSFVLEHLDYTKWRVIALDLLGFGDAPKPNISYTPTDHADAVLQTLDDLGVKEAVFAGHSMGCIIAINIAHRFPERALQTILLGAPIYKQAPKGGTWNKLTRREGLYFSIFEIVKANPDAVQAGGTIADELVPFVKGMEITEETWPAYKKSLENTIMQYESFKQATELQVPSLFVNGLLDFFIIRKNIRTIRRTNKKYISIKRTLGPHELTPRQGGVIAKIINKLPAKD